MEPIDIDSVPPRNFSTEWLQQFDPRSQQLYYYNVVSGAVQWERPLDFADGVDPTPETHGAVVIQSAFRGKRTRDAAATAAATVASNESHYNLVNEQGGDCSDGGGARVDVVEDRTDVDTEADGDWQSPVNEQESAADDESNESADHTVAGVGIECDSSINDRRHPQREAESSAALSIQCAFRQRVAGKAVETKRSHLRDITDPDVIDRKIADIMRALDEVASEIHTRRLVSEHESDEFPHLRELLNSWTTTFDALRGRIHTLPTIGEHVKSVEFAGEKVVRAQELHDAMADARRDCLALLRSIFLMNSYFLDLDVQRINDAAAALQRWKQHELCALADPRIGKAVQLDDLHDIFAHAEAALRRAMGLTDFHACATTAAGKRYEEWHLEAAAALASIRQMEQRLQHKIHLLHAVRLAEVEKRETSLMETEDRASAQIEKRQRARADQAIAYAAFLVTCREGWQKGLEKRQHDEQTAIALETAQRDAVAHKMALVEKMHKRELHRRATTKLSIWEAVKEGLPVEIVRTMVFAEMQKARRLGYDFELRTARSDYGETMVQIACWWGHEHLVSFLLDEGANVHDVDSYCNKFSLLHDVARRGHGQVIRLLLQRGLKHDITDSSGDTPLHWAARKNHYDAVHTLLEAHVPRAEPNTLDVILRAVHTKNHRGKTPFQVATNTSVRRLIQAFDDGRLLLFRHPRATVAPASGHRRMTDFPRQESASHRGLLGDLKTVTRTHSSKSFASTSSLESRAASEDEFGIIAVLTPRQSEPQRMRRSNSSRVINA